MVKRKARKRVWRVANYFDAIIAGVEQGKTLKTIARAIPAQPDIAVLLNFLRRSPHRWARYQAARAAAGTVKTIGEAAYTTALKTIATTDIVHLTRWKAPGLPNLNTMRARAARDPAFRKRLDAALELRRRRVRPKRFLLSDHERALTFIAKHAGKTLEQIDPLLRAAFLPSIEAMRCRARTNAAFGQKFRALNEQRGVVRFTQDGIASALEALRADPHTSCVRILPQRVGLIPSAVALRTRLRTHPGLAVAYSAIMAERRVARGRTLPSIRRARPIGHVTTSVPADLITQAQALVPRWSDAAVADDIRSELVLAVLSGDCTLATLPAMARRIIGRMSDRWSISADMTVGEGGGTLVDVMTADRYTFEDAI